VCNQTHIRGSDMDEFGPDFAKDQDAYRHADIDLVPRGIDVTAGKTFDPTSITEPSHGPVTVTLSGQPSGPSRTVQMVITDDSGSFWTAYALASLPNGASTTPINRVRVDAHTGGRWSVDAGGDPVLTGGTWHPGTATSGPGLALPDGVTAD